MKTHKTELTFAGIFLVIYLVMIGGYKHFNTGLLYEEIAGFLLITTVFLVSRVAWENFKKNLSE